MVESRSNKIDLDMDENIAEEMFRFIYTGMVEGLEQIAAELLHVAVMVSHECKCHMHIELLHSFRYRQYSYINFYGTPNLATAKVVADPTTNLEACERRDAI